MAKEKQVTKRLTFTEDAAEQALLAMAEARVAAGDFPAFNELGKAALQAFLSPATVPQPPATTDDPVADPMTQPANQIEQALDALGATQQAMQSVLQQIATQTAAPARVAIADQPDIVVQSLHDFQAAHQALQAEVRQLAASLTAELSKWQVQQAPVNNAHQPVATQATPASDQAVSQETVNRLARFLEDF